MIEFSDPCTELAMVQLQTSCLLSFLQLEETKTQTNAGLPEPITNAFATEPAQQKSQEELWAEYNALPLEARNAFYLHHRDKLRP